MCCVIPFQTELHGISVMPSCVQKYCSYASEINFIHQMDSFAFVCRMFSLLVRESFLIQENVFPFSSGDLFSPGVRDYTSFVMLIKSGLVQSGVFFMLNNQTSLCSCEDVIPQSLAHWSQHRLCCAYFQPIGCLLFQLMNVLCRSNKLMQDIFY